MATVGTGITHLTPSRGFAAQLATASTVVIASGTGLPISTTQTLVGAIRITSYNVCYTKLLRSICCSTSSSGTRSRYWRNSSRY